MRLKLLVISLLLSCGAPTPDQPAPSTVIADPLPLPMCTLPNNEQITVFTDAYNGCHQPNPGLYHGALCFANEQWACDVIHNFLTETTLLKDLIHPDANHGGSGSRDELIGHLLYIAKTHDKNHANKLIDMIQHNANRVCTDATDNRCDVTPTMYGLMRIVWNHIGLTPTKNMLISNIGDDHTLLIEASTAPIGYQLHLIALQLLIRQHTNTWSTTMDATSKELLNRMPNNLLIRYINGLDVSKELDTAISDQNANPPKVIRNWPWARETTGNEDTPAGYLFLKNLILKK